MTQYLLTTWLWKWHNSYEKLNKVFMTQFSFNLKTSVGLPHSLFHYIHSIINAKVMRWCRTPVQHYLRGGICFLALQRTYVRSQAIKTCVPILKVPIWEIFRNQFSSGFIIFTCKMNAECKRLLPFPNFENLIKNSTTRLQNNWCFVFMIKHFAFTCCIVHPHTVIAFTFC